VEAEFRLLGEIELRVGDRVIDRVIDSVVDLGHARQRCVLAVLLVDANRLVTADQLLDRVWADRPPRRARNALSGYLSRLRSLLGSLPQPLDVAIERAPGGYTLNIEESMVDIHQFQALAGKGRATGDESLMERALGLWRGEAFGTLDTPWINDVRARLDAERRAVELDFNDLALASGRHSELLADLYARARETPQDERLAGQLMLALYRGGRQSEALRHYEMPGGRAKPATLGRMHCLFWRSWTILRPVPCGNAFGGSPTRETRGFPTAPAGRRSPARGRA